MFETILQVHCRIAGKEIQTQIDWLEEQIVVQTKELGLAKAEIKVIEGELKEFTDGYYKNVGMAFQENKKLAARLAKIGIFLEKDYEDEKIEYENEDEMVFTLSKKPSPKENKEAVEKEVKRIFRKMAKHVHPDTAEDAQAKEAFSVLNECYKKNDLSALVGLEMEYANKINEKESLPQKLERLEKHHKNIISERESIISKKFEIELLPEYKLMQKVNWRMLFGDDLVARIKNKITKQVMRKRALLGELEMGVAETNVPESDSMFNEIAYQA